MRKSNFSYLNYIHGMRFLIVLYALCLSSVFAAVNEAKRNVPPGFLNDNQHIKGGEFNTKNRLDLLKQLHLRSKQQLDTHQRIQQKVSMCDRCHASALHSQNSFLPILQGQNLDYLFSKILFFKLDERSFHPLQSVSQGLSIDDVMDISLYYANQSSDLGKSLVVSKFPENKSETSDVDSIQSCTDCHGADGNGEQLIPIISGQNENYLNYRIREISREDSKVHLGSVAAVNCEIPAVDLDDSNRLARVLALVLDSESIFRGAQIYHQVCARCHDHGEQGAPKLSDKKSWSTRIRQGTRELVKNTVIGKSNMPLWGGDSRLSRNQLKDAIHFMIHQASLSR